MKAAFLSRVYISNLEAPNMPKNISVEKFIDIAYALNAPVMSFFDFRE